MSYTTRQLYTLTRQSVDQVECKYEELYRPTGKRYKRSVFCKNREDFQKCLEEWNRNNRSIMPGKKGRREFKAR